MRHYIVERASDGKFLEMELPIAVSKAGRRRGGAGQFAGTIAPDVGGLRDETGRLIIDPYATFIHEEEDGVIRGSWWVTRSEIDGDSWAVEGQGFSSYFADRPYEGEYRGVRVDPIAVAREIVTRAQAAVGSDIGVTVAGSSTVRVGTDSDIKADHAKAVTDAKQKAWDEFAKPRKALESKVKALSKPHDDAIAVMNRDRRVLVDSYAAAVSGKLPQATIDARKALVTAKDQQIKDRRAVKDAAVKPLKDQIEDLKVTEQPLKDAYEAAKADSDAAAEKARDDEGSWRLLWWDTPDCLDAFDEAVEAAGFEWVEWSGWNTDRTKILKELRCVPRVGTKRSDLSFVEGENVIEAVVVEDDSAEYANTVLAIGAGEGKKALRFTVGQPDGRRRKVRVLDAKHITKQAALETAARQELSAAMQTLRVAAIKVDGTREQAPKALVNVGDEILVDAEVGWLGRQKLWRRVSEITWDDSDELSIFLEDV